MTVREFKELVNAIPATDDDCLVVAPVKTELPGLFAFEGVCPAVTEIITVAKSPEFIQGDPINKDEEVRVFLIAPHSFHDNDEDLDNEEHAHNKEQLN